MSFDNEGFAGASGLSIRARQLRDHEELFEFAESCSKLALEITALLPDLRGKTELTASLFFSRCTSHFQAAICLTEGGMTIEALVLCRGLLETFFVLNALADGFVTVADLVDHDDASRRVQADSLLKKMKQYENVIPFESILREFHDQRIGLNKTNFYDLADKGSMLAVYDGLYRYLSNFAAHASLSATDPYIVKMPGDKSHVKYRPIFNYTKRAILIACQGILMSCHACEKLGICTPKTNAVVAQLLETYHMLYATHDPLLNSENDHEG